METNEQFLIEPTFNGAGGGGVIEFQVGAINALADAEFNSHVGFYQNLLGIYSYMKMDQLGDYVIHYPVGNALLLQPHNSCAWTPQGNFRYAQKKITPFRAKINVEDCYDEHFGSTFERFLEWGNSAEVSMSAAGVAATNAMSRLVVENTTLGVRATLTAGGLFTGDETFEEGVPTTIRDAFRKSATLGMGWIQSARTLAAGDVPKYGHLDNDLIDNADISADGELYEGNSVTLFDARVTAAPRKLRRAIKRGGRGGFNNRNVPIWLVSSSIADDVYEQYQAQSVAIATNRQRITIQEFNVPNGRQGTSTLMLYYIDKVAVVPVEEIEVFSDFLTGTPHFDYLTMTGVIQLGGSFGRLPERAAANVAVRIEKSDRNQDLGKITYLAHMLLASAFNDTDYLAGGYRFSVPA